MCCWACVPCKKHEYMVSYKECADCGAGKWPHENRTSCYELPAKVSDTHSFLITLIYYHHYTLKPLGRLHFTVCSKFGRPISNVSSGKTNQLFDLKIQIYYTHFSSIFCSSCQIQCFLHTVAAILKS